MINGFIEYGNLEKIVLKKLKDLGITENDYPLNPYELVAREGIILQEEPLDNVNIRGMIVCGDNCTGIVVNKNRKRKSKNYIVMHELSHFWYHPRNCKYVCLEDYVDHFKDIEWQANNAASIALMPPSIFKRLYHECGGNVNCLSDYFDVGISAIRYRMQRLGIEEKLENANGYHIDFNKFSETAFKKHLLYGC